MTDERRTSGVGREISWTAIAAGTTLAFTVVVPLAGAYDFIRTELADIRLDVSSNFQARCEQERTAAIWIERIKDNASAIHELEQQVSRLQAVPTARPDPFTGTQGRELERRLKLLEQGE